MRLEHYLVAFPQNIADARHVCNDLQPNASLLEAQWWHLDRTPGVVKPKFNTWKLSAEREKYQTNFWQF